MKQVIEDAKALVKQKLQAHPNRLNHSYGVSLMAKKLAVHYDVDANKAELAGIFHDYCKYDTITEQVAFLDKEIIEMYQAYPVVYHAFAAAEALKRLLNIHDEDVLNAIRYHVWGRPQMTTLEKIIYVADYCELSRPFQDREHIETLAFKDLDEAVRYCMASSMDDLKQRGLTPSEASLRAYQCYMEVESGTNQ